MDSVFSDQSVANTANNGSAIFVFDFIVSKLITYGTIICLIGYVLYQGGRPFTQRFFLLPPTEFRETLQVATTKNSGLLSSAKVGIKKASFRRRLIMGGLKPQVYSTLPFNSTDLNNEEINNTDSKYYKLRVAKIDREPENVDKFLMNIKPIEPQSLNRRKLFGFFHPFSYALGGGEKVLWESVISTLENDINNIAIIYTFTPTTNTSIYSILNNVKLTFDIDLLRPDRSLLRDRIVFIHLNDKYQWLIKGESYKFLSMIGQAIGSIFLTINAFQQVTPDVYIDTIGVPFTYLLIYAFLDIPIISYIHYPTISKDMLNSVKNIGGLYGKIKFIYWWILLKLYAFNIMWVDLTLFNSTWTAENVSYALGWITNDEDIEKSIVYPPCVSYDEPINNDKNDLINKKREKTIVYLAQFRPEKRHLLLLKHYKEYLKIYENEGIKEPYKLIFIGSTRSIKDEEYVNKLKEEIEILNIPKENVIFELNLSNSNVEICLKNSDFGINCMWKEHFGISVVEYMLNGAIPLVHASAGPLEDIVIPYINNDHSITKKERKEKIKIEETEISGLFFKDITDNDYSTNNIENYLNLTEMLIKASKLDEKLKKRIRINAIEVANEKFGKGVFSAKWTQNIYEISKIETERRENRGKVEQAY